MSDYTDEDLAFLVHLARHPRSLHLTAGAIIDHWRHSVKYDERVKQQATPEQVDRLQATAKEAERMANEAARKLEP